MNSKFLEIAQQITNEVISELQKGNIVWNQPWGSFGAARNYLSKRPYEGFNQFYLSYKAAKRNYTTPFYLTYKQAQDLGGYIRKGEKATPVIFWKVSVRKTGRKVVDKSGAEKEEETTLFFPFIHHVFNVDQVTGVTFEIPAGILHDNTPIEACEKIVTDMPRCPQIKHGGSEASYAPVNDFIQMPKIEHFKSSGSYYAVLFHELIHSTGHHTRLNRFGEGDRPSKFGSEDYSKEELIAEMGATFLCGYANIKKETFHNSIAYLQSWIKRLQEDHTLIIHAANKAGKAASYILDITEEVGETIEESKMETA